MMGLVLVKASFLFCYVVIPEICVPKLDVEGRCAWEGFGHVYLSYPAFCLWSVLMLKWNKLSRL